MNAEVEALIEQLRSTIQQARSMPMSSSAVIHRAEILAQVDAIQAALPEAFAESDAVYSKREQLVADAQAQADRIVVEARNEHERLVSDSEVYRVAKHEADSERGKVEAECEALRKETDEYVDGRLANLEIIMTKTLDVVTRGRDRLHGRSDLDRLDDVDDEPGFPFAGRHSGSPSI